MPHTDRFLPGFVTKALGATLAVLAMALAIGHGPLRGQSVGKAQNAEALVKAGHWKRARQILEPQVKEHPQDARGCYLLSQVKLAFGDLNEALLFAQHAVELDGRNSAFHLQLGKVYGEMASRAGYLSAGPLAIKFRKQVETAIDLDPRNIDALDAMMQFKYQAPGIMGGSRDEADALAEKIAALSPVEGFLARAELAGIEKQPLDEEVFYLKAAQANPKSYDAAVSLAKFYGQSARAKYGDAEKFARAAIQIDSGRVDAHWVLAKVYASRQAWNDLDQELPRAEADVPDDLRPDFEAAQALFDIGKNFQRAEACLKKYLSQEPEAGEPDGAEAHRLLGLMFEKEGRKGEALAEIRAALRIRPNFKEAKEDLKRLED